MNTTIRKYSSRVSFAWSHLQVLFHSSVFISESISESWFDCQPHVSIHPIIRPSIRSFNHLSVHLLVQSFVHPFKYLSMYQYVHPPSIYVYVRMYVCMFVCLYLFIYLFIYLLIYSFIQRFIYLFIHSSFYSSLYMPSLIQFHAQGKSQQQQQQKFTETNFKAIAFLATAQVSFSSRCGIQCTRSFPSLST